MNVEYISAFAALGGSIVGGLITGTANWFAQVIQVRAGQRAREVTHREDLFRDFIVAASKAYGQAMVSDQPQIQDIVGMYGMINRMQVLCSPPTIADAQRVMQTTIETYFQPNKTFPDILALMKSGKWTGPLSDFAEAARTELRSLEAIR
jgi:hypothetical protein